MTTVNVTHLEATSSRPVRSSHAGLLTTMLLVAPAVAILLAPFAILAAAAIEQPTIVAALTEMPATAAQLGLGLIISVLFCILPFYLRTADVSREPISGDLSKDAAVKPAAVIALPTRDDATTARPLAA